jgi:lipoprotein-anchoring transpeptidase ErfK/SrfK
MKPAWFAALSLIWLASCSPPTAQDTAADEVESATPTIALSETARAEMLRVNAARFSQPPEASTADTDAASEQVSTEAQPAEAPSFDAALVRTQVLLDRAHFSPGAIDGSSNDNMSKAIWAYQTAHGIAVDGLASDALLEQLEARDAAPALAPYVISEADVRGPFVAVPRSLLGMSRLRRLAYSGPAEAIAEKFHMDEALLLALNPGVELEAGTEIVVANAGGGLDAQVAAIEVDKDAVAVRAYGAGGDLLAFYPATIGSGDAPTPSGEHRVVSVSFNPTYRYDPARLPSFGDRGHGAVTIRPGPNNPVGLVWIALSRRSYGIHGTPQPSLIGRTQSHGCVRLTNWDAIELGRAVRPGTPVTFIGGEIAVVADEETGL